MLEIISMKVTNYCVSKMCLTKTQQLTMFYAPRRTSNYSVSLRERKNLKLRALFFIVLYGMAAWLFSGDFRDIITLAAAAETLTLIPKTR